jgi:pimeloyl-ACP methyl ester carboxylesterase
MEQQPTERKVRVPRAGTRVSLTFFIFLCCVIPGLTGCHVPGSLHRHAGTATGRPGGATPLAQDLDLVAADPESVSGKQAGGRIVERWCASGAPGTMVAGRWTVRITSEWPLAYFDTLLPAADHDVRRLRHRHTRDGQGVALIGCRRNTLREPVEALYPPELITRPVTAVFKTGPASTITIALKDPRHHEKLAADFTAPLAQLLGQARALKKLGLGGLLGTSGARQRGYSLYLMEPYDPRKTPVLFVHGLLSTPLAWANATNELWGDAEFRRHCQVWHFYYPTSAPFLYSAKMLRQRLQETRALLDPKGRHPASARLHLVTHSMGGLLARTLITDSDELIWNRVFSVPPAALRANEDDRHTVSDILHWKARGDVRRVIFVAVPHRGSPMTQDFAGRVGDALAKLPVRFTALYARLIRDNPEAIQPAFRETLSRGKLTSIDTLSPRHPLLELLVRLPFAPQVTAHSIIGNRGRSGPLAESSDGVVPYSSSHLDAAVSELIVPAGHGAYKDPRTAAEILRILR